MALQPMIMPVVVFNFDQIHQPHPGNEISMPQFPPPAHVSIAPTYHQSAQQVRPQKIAPPTYPPPPHQFQQWQFPRDHTNPNQDSTLPPKSVLRPSVPPSNIDHSKVMSFKQDYTLPPKLIHAPRPSVPPSIIYHSSVSAGAPHGAFIAPKRDYALPYKLVRPLQPHVQPSIIYHGSTNAPAPRTVHRPPNVNSQTHQHSPPSPKRKLLNPNYSKKSDVKRSLNTSKRHTEVKSELKTEYRHKAEAAVAMMGLAKCSFSYKGKLIAE